MFDLFLSALSAINIFEEYMLSLRRNKKFRKNLSSALKIPFDNLTQSYDNMIESFYRRGTLS